MDFDFNDEQRLWRKTVHEFVLAELRPKAREVDEKGEFNWEATRKMGPLGLLGLAAIIVRIIVCNKGET